MKRWLGCTCVCVLVLALNVVSTSGARPLRVRVVGGCRSQQVVVRNQVVVNSQAAVFTAVPFAVPVAVPVATVVQPTYFYAYGTYAAPAGPTATSTVATTDRDAEIPETPELREEDILEENSEILDRQAVDVLIKRCVECHSGEGAGGDLVMADEAGHMAAKLPRHRLLRAIESGKMPPPQETSPLLPSDIEAIRHWARLPRDLAY